MNKRTIIGICISFFLIASCQTGKLKKLRTDDDNVSIIILQLNDVSEIAPLPGSEVGGLSRVAAIREELLKETSAVFTVFCGGMFHPSPISSLELEGEVVEGKQMIQTMNQMGVDIATFGNHAFDLEKETLQKRIDASDFLWISSNVQQRVEDTLLPFKQNFWGYETEVPTFAVLNVVDEDGTFLKVGVFAVSAPGNWGDYTIAKNMVTSAKEAYSALKTEVDFSIGISHLNYKDDVLVAQALPGLKLIMGGQDRRNMAQMVNGTLITKADANAASVYVHRLSYDKNSKKLTIDSELLRVDQSIDPEPQTAALINTWQEKTTLAFQQQGFDINEVIATVSTPYDGRTSSMNDRQTNMGDLVLKAIVDASPEAECALMTSELVTLDDVLEGDITQYDILRSLTDAGDLITVSMDGSVLYDLISSGLERKGTSGFLQIWNIDPNIGINSYFTGKRRIMPGSQFIVVMPEKMLSEDHDYFELLTEANPGISVLSDSVQGSDAADKRDIRKIVVNYLRRGGR